MNDKTNETIRPELEQKLESADPRAVSAKLAADVMIQIEKLQQDKKS